uniref:nicotinate phosphoribosyltransferase n=1 Tax=Echinostoma caproni TaxID=27848 RepID=A0A183BE23_9TREM
LAGKLFGIPVVGTHAHSFVSVYQEKTASSCINDTVNHVKASHGNGTSVNDCAEANGLLDLHEEPLDLNRFMERCWYWSRHLGTVLDYIPDQLHAGELAAFANYAYAFPSQFVGLIDTYDVLK